MEKVPAPVQSPARDERRSVCRDVQRIFVTNAGVNTDVRRKFRQGGATLQSAQATCQQLRRRPKQIEPKV